MGMKKKLIKIITKKLRKKLINFDMSFQETVINSDNKTYIFNNISYDVNIVRYKHSLVFNISDKILKENASFEIKVANYINECYYKIDKRIIPTELSKLTELFLDYSIKILKKNYE